MEKNGNSSVDSKIDKTQKVNHNWNTNSRSANQTKVHNESN